MQLQLQLQLQLHQQIAADGWMSMEVLRSLRLLMCHDLGHQALTLKWHKCELEQLEQLE